MLGGVKALSFIHYLQGSSAAQILADLGAEVVKVKPPRGAYERSWPGCNTYPGGVSISSLLGNRNQTSATTDLKSREGVEIIHKLLQEYDMVIENFRAGVTEKPGLGYESLKKINPGIIYCSCFDYGSFGPYVKKSGQNLLIQSMNDLVSLIGSDPKVPSPVGVPIVDQRGAVLAALGVAASIYDRARAGKDHKVEASLLGSALDLQQEALGYYFNGGQLTGCPTTGPSTRFHQSPYGVYRAEDDCIILSLTPVEKLKELFMPGYLDGYTSGDQMEHGLEFGAVVCRKVKKEITGEWKKIFDENDIWYAPVSDYQEILENRQVRYNGDILTMYHPAAGDVRVVGRTNRYDEENTKIRKLPPKLGESTRILIGHLGYNEEIIRRCREHGIITMEEWQGWSI